jgi:hypothetical protein
MGQPAKETGPLNVPDELLKRKRIILGKLKERTLWFIKLRWWAGDCQGDCEPTWWTVQCRE